MRRISMLKKYNALILFIISLCLLLFSGKKIQAAYEGFTAQQTNETIVADGVKDAAYSAATAISVSHVSWENENQTPATATMYLLWDTSYLYVFVEVIDDTHYGYQEGTWLEHRDALEMFVDLYHDTSYTGGYGGDYRGDMMCEGYYKIAAGVGTASVDTTVQGMHWMWDDQKNNGSYASVLTENGYTVEHKIALGKDAATYMLAEREIGLGVKIYDKHADDKNNSITVLEAKNDGQHDGPHNLSTVKLLGLTEPEQPEIVSGFTATELPDTSNIVVDGVKDAFWNYATPINIDQIRKLFLFNEAKSNTNPALGNISAMYDTNHLYLFAEISDSTKDMNNISAWDAFGLNAYNSYKYHADHLDVYLDIKHNDPTNYDQKWGSSYNDGKDVVAHLELAAGVGELSYTADGVSGLMYQPSTDGEFSLSQYIINHSTMYSKVTEAGYTFEMVIDLSEAEVADFMIGKTIGLYVGYYDRYETSDEVANWGEQSITTTSFGFDNYEPWNGPGWLPEVTFVPNDTSTVLENAKENAKLELAKYDSNLYREAEQAILNSTIETAILSINNAMTLVEINSALTTAQEAIASLKTKAQYESEEMAKELAEVKENAKSQLSSYRVADLYYDVEKQQLITAIENGKLAIDACGTKEEVNEALDLAKKAIDEIKTIAEYEKEVFDKILAEAKASAKAELKAYKSVDDYLVNEGVTYLITVDNGNAAIDACQTVEAVSNALNAAKKAIDSIKTKAQYEVELATAKANAKSALAAYKNADLYRDAEKQQLASTIESGNAAIDACETIEDVNKALNAAKKTIDNIKTAAQYEAEEPAETGGCNGSFTVTLCSLLLLVSLAFFLKRKENLSK